MPAQSTLLGNGDGRPTASSTKAIWQLRKQFALGVGKLLFGVTLNQIDVVSDLLIARQYYMQGDQNWAILCVGLIGGSGLMSAGAQLALNYLNRGASRVRKVLMPFLSIVQLHMIIEVAEGISLLKDKYKTDLAHLQAFGGDEEGQELIEVGEVPNRAWWRHPDGRRCDSIFPEAYENVETMQTFIKTNVGVLLDFYKTKRKRASQEDQLTKLWQDGKLEGADLRKLDKLQQLTRQENEFWSFFMHASYANVDTFQLLPGNLRDEPELISHINACAALKAFHDKEIGLVVMKAVESLAESTPQGGFQMYVAFFMYYTRNQPPSWLQAVSASMSVMSIAFAVTDMIKKVSDPEVRTRLGLGQLMQLFVFNVTDIALRIGSGAVFLAQLEFRPYSFAICGALPVIYLIEALVAVGSEGPSGLAGKAFMVIIVAFVLCCSAGPVTCALMARLNPFHSSLDPKSIRNGILEWVHRGFEFFALGGSALYNRWECAEHPPIVGVALFGTLYVAWLSLSIVLRCSSWLGYREHGWRTYVPEEP